MKIITRAAFGTTLSLLVIASLIAEDKPPAPLPSKSIPAELRAEYWQIQAEHLPVDAAYQASSAKVNAAVAKMNEACGEGWAPALQDGKPGERKELVCVKAPMPVPLPAVAAPPAEPSDPPTPSTPSAK